MQRTTLATPEALPPTTLPAVPLSIVVATTDPWPAVRDCLDRLRPQAKAMGAEMILADSTTRGMPTMAGSGYEDVRWLKVPGASVFELRARAVALARGGIVALTEDHCLARPDWCE